MRLRPSDRDAYKAAIATKNAAPIIPIPIETRSPAFLLADAAVGEDVPVLEALAEELAVVVAPVVEAVDEAELLEEAELSDADEAADIVVADVEAADADEAELVAAAPVPVEVSTAV